MTDKTILSSQIVEKIRLIRSEKEVSQFIARNVSDLRKEGFSEVEIMNLIQQVYSQLHSLNPVLVADSDEWNMIIHAKVELFRMESKMTLPEL